MISFFMYMVYTFGPLIIIMGVDSILQYYGLLKSRKSTTVVKRTVKYGLKPYEFSYPAFAVFIAWYVFLIYITLPSRYSLSDLLVYTVLTGFLGGISLGQLIDSVMGWNLMGING